MVENGYAKPVLVTTEWLAEHLNDENLVVAEVDENPDLYEEGHVVGAVKLHWREDLQDPVERDLVDKPTFERLMSDRGISNDTTLILYGDKNNWFAAYAYWYLKIYGHRDVRILDGGRQKWADENREFTTDSPQPGQADYRAGERDESIRTYRDTVLYSTLMPCFLCSGAAVQFGIPMVVVGESINFHGAPEFMRQHGIEVVDLDLPECVEMMEKFIRENPSLWNEDIGVE